LLAYNLIRGVLVQAAVQRGVMPRESSFAGTMQVLGSFAPLLVLVVESALNAYVAASWQALGTHRVGDRPGRVEPRAIKRRRREYPELHQPLLLQQI
jgi:hypothetical protein